ncbi:beta 1-4 rhamnosyltransferase Cps2T [Bariatricus sp. HCP28S3_C2]|uniref:beta 1-4 rhamnosyltransferase Cps2T n=1 Tax=unclassified Bariatricus TaxID=2677046 RepID=UPI003F8A1547
MQHVFLVGAKSLGAYGGYETFINKLTEYHQSNPDIKYHVAVKANGQGASVPDGAVWNCDRYTYHNADCFQIKIPECLGSAQAIYYDCKALGRCVEIIKEEGIEHPIVYVMACRIGPFFNHYVKKIHRLGGRVFLNPDGHEWKRAKWSKLVRAYWKKSEELMVKHSDLIICDSINIEKYIRESYGVKNTTFIAYGAETRKSVGAEDRYEVWLKEKGLRDSEFYLVVGRFVPENNYETMIREFMKSKTDKDFAIITNVNDGFLAELEQKLGFRKDKRIKFVGTVYDQELLMKIRENAYGYFHGHEVGGTNPSLLEALSSTDLNLPIAVSFNKEVCEDAAVYWSKQDGDLAGIINKADKMSEEEIRQLGRKAKRRIKEAYSWEHIAQLYEDVFLGKS